MSVHVRTAVRRAAGATLAAWPGLAGVRVHTARLSPVGMKTPGAVAIEILTPREASTRIAGGDGRYDRTIDLMVVGYVAVGGADDAADNAADARDALAAEIEAAFAAAFAEITPGDTRALNGAALDMWLDATDMALDQAAFPGGGFAQTWKVEVVDL